MKNTSVDISVKPFARDQPYIMTTANCAFEVFVQNAAYAKMLFGTFPIMRVNTYYRQMIDKQELAGASYQHMCGCCRKKRTICIYDTALGNFACLVCRANVARPWFDSDANQYIGYGTENRHDFFLDLKYWNWKTALSNEMPLYSHWEFPNRPFPPCQLLGKYLASPTTWTSKWIDILLQPTDVDDADEARYFLWHWYRHYIIDDVPDFSDRPPNRNTLSLEQYAANPAHAWKNASAAYFDDGVPTAMEDEESEEEESPTQEYELLGNEPMFGPFQRSVWADRQLHDL